MTKPNETLLSAAVLTIKKPGAMTPKGREEIARWLRRNANHLVKCGADYNATGNFVGRYLIVPEDPA